MKLYQLILVVISPFEEIPVGIHVGSPGIYMG